MLIIRVVALVCLIVSLASAQLPVPGSVGGGSGTAAPPYAKAFTAVTTITATAVQHGMGTTAIPGDCYDNGTRPHWSRSRQDFRSEPLMETSRGRGPAVRPEPATSGTRRHPDRPAVICPAITRIQR
jgi:hypothetical protein